MRLTRWRALAFFSCHDPSGGAVEGEQGAPGYALGQGAVEEGQERLPEEAQDDQQIQG